jgi:type VI secretion system secreted protein Hcp
LVQQEGTVAYQFYVTIQGAKQGKLKGDALSKSQVGKMIGLKFEYEVTSPRDLATGQASGKRMHKPFTITKEWGAASPQLLRACATNEVLNMVLLEFFHTTATGEERLHHTIKLTNASISNLKQYVADPVMAAEYDAAELEEISFTYQRITFEDKVGKTTAVDDWEART